VGHADAAALALCRYKRQTRAPCFLPSSGRACTVLEARTIKKASLVCLESPSLLCAASRAFVQQDLRRVSSLKRAPSLSQSNRTQPTQASPDAHDMRHRLLAAPPAARPQVLLRCGCWKMRVERLLPYKDTPGGPGSLQRRYPMLATFARRLKAVPSRRCGRGQQRVRRPGEAHMRRPPPVRHGSQT